MFARVSTVQGTPDKIEAGIRHYREQVLPTANKLAGFKGAYLLVDRKSGKELSVTLWDTERHMQESAKTAEQLRSQASQAVAASQPATVEMFEVAVEQQPAREEISASARLM
ncbi:MAG: hypothetical protein HYX96_03555 [Chloroflexi bacterium]|nr:hypothetical protein [Chloroflexota bacterium]